MKSVKFKKFLGFCGLFCLFSLVLFLTVQISEAGKNDDQTENAEEHPQVKLRDGTYEGRTAANYRGTVIVTVKEGRIKAIEAKPLGKDARYKKEIDAILSKVVETQQYQVDAYSGATRYTIAVVQAVQNALRDAEEKVS